MVKIAFISQPEYFRFCYEDDLHRLGEVLEFPFKYHMKDQDLRDLVEFNADFNFFFRGEFFPENVLPKLTGKKVCLSSEPFPGIINGKLKYTRDSYCRYKSFKPIATKKFDYLFHYDATSLPFFKSEGLEISGIFPFPVATGVYRKVEMQKMWDFFFIGRSTPHREEFFGQLKHCYNFLHICHGVWGRDLVQYANQSKILLNVHAENEISWEPRLQMLMATGNLVISEQVSPNSILQPGVDFVEVTSPKELFEAGEYYLHNEKEREAIACNAVEKIFKKLDSKQVFGTLIHDIQNGVYPRFQSSRIPPLNYRMEINSLLLRLESIARASLS